MQPTLLPEKRWKRNALSAVILFNLIAVPLGSYWTQNPDHPNALGKLLGNYVYAMRIRQYWALFSPEPRHAATRYSALIMFKSGKIVTWTRPYPPKWNFFERNLAYNFQKWDLVSDHLDRKSFLWDSLVHYLTTIYRDENNPISEIHFVRSTAFWPKPNPTGYVGGDERDLKWSNVILFRYDALNQRYL
jgi:hypothetical protein